MKTAKICWRLKASPLDPRFCATLPNPWCATEAVAVAKKKNLPESVNIAQWRGNVFWTGGAQNSKIVSTSGGRSPPDSPFLQSTFLRAGRTADLS